jgi:regulator of protease activity HflC (stomatin/prohibitin superfamily)
MDITPRKITAIICAIALVGALALMGNFAEQVDADEICVIQAPLSGDLAIYSTPGTKWQGFGRVTCYPRRGIYDFGDGAGIKVRFNDGAHGTMLGSIQYELPVDDDTVREMHMRFGNANAVQRQLIQTVVDKAVYMSGPLMSSKESYAERRNSLIWYVEDQVQDGVYKTTQKDVYQKDVVTDQGRMVTVVELVLDPATNVPMRQEAAPLKQFGIKTYNFSMKSLEYDEKVEAQIAAQQQATMDVQTAMAESKKAEQRALTAEKEGQANAAKSKWEAEVVKAKAVVEAEQRKSVAVTQAEQQYEVAQLEAKAMIEYKNGQLAKAEGDATYKEKVMKADGALQAKLDAFKDINAHYAQALGSYQGNLVPGVVFAGNGVSNGGQQASVLSLVDMLMVKTAKDLALDMDVQRTGKGG